LYELDMSIKEKLEIISKEIYRAKGVVYASKADKEIKKIEEMGFGDLPICVAKTPYSLSDDPSINILTDDYEITIRDIR
ncbi:formate--tetrahydrofolate ligase, partial [Bacillus thuringiensis]|nr:formate--tetrahydrofolate ligase [Bacillus thuringiensis]